MSEKCGEMVTTCTVSTERFQNAICRPAHFMSFFMRPHLIKGPYQWTPLECSATADMEVVMWHQDGETHSIYDD